MYVLPGRKGSINSLYVSDVSVKDWCVVSCCRLLVARTSQLTLSVRPSSGLQLLSELSEPELERLAAGGGGGSSTARRRRRRGLGLMLQRRTGQTAPAPAPAWLVPGERPPPPVREAFPRPPTAPGELTPSRRVTQTCQMVKEIRN